MKLSKPLAALDEKEYTSEDATATQPPCDVVRANAHFDAALAEIETGLAEIRTGNAQSQLRVREAILADAKQRTHEEV